MKKKKEEAFKSIRIMTFDGSRIYREMNREDGKNGLTFKNDKGEIDPNRFAGLIDASLDTEKMKRVYSAHEECEGKFRTKGNCTTAVVNVSFDFSVKDFYPIKDRIYVREGYGDFDPEDLSDHVCVIEDEGEKILVAIEVTDADVPGCEDYAPVEEPVSIELLDGVFSFDQDKKAYFIDKKYVKKSQKESPKNIGAPIRTKADKEEVRTWLYRNGFDIDGVHYVRYKRSAGSSREGHCLFIAEPLYNDMIEWSSCGLDAEKVSDQASFQAYMSLTLSSIEKIINIPKQSILLIRDQHSIFTDKVIRVVEKGSNLDAICEDAEIDNIVWDGEALLDSSVFKENGYPEKGMMLLRNRFFKTCAFNTNLEQWFKDNGITRPSQLNGYYSSSVRSIEDIKLVITESSLKYLKFKPEEASLKEWFEKWLDNIYVNKEEAAFGVVKTDKPTGPMENRMVRTNYQLLNTLAMTKDDVNAFLALSLEYLHNIQNDPMYLRYYSNLWVNDEFDEKYEKYVDEVASDNYRQRLISDIMRRTDDFERTKFYSDYRTDLCKSFKKKLKNGRVLVDGSYHTLFGNGLEFLHAVIDKNYVVDEPLALGDGEIYTKRFGDGEQLLCARSPHITMGNILVAKNKYVEEYDKYFNLGAARAIVCVNSIKSNIMQRLNGCDYDSDAMLITNNPTLCRIAASQYSTFPVPVCEVKPSGKVNYTTSPESLAELDVKLSENKIGEVVNLSQFLNSLYWDKLHHGAGPDELDPLYLDICKLAVLSGMEIDKAKRIYSVSADTVLSDLRKHKEKYKKENAGRIPEFFAFITDDDSVGKTSPDAKLETAMSLIFDAVNSDTERAPKKARIPYIDLFEVDKKVSDPNGKYSKECDSIMGFVKNHQNEMRQINFAAKKKERSEKAISRERSNELFKECIDCITNKAEEETMVFLLKKLDRGVSGFHALLLASMCYAGEGYLMKKLKKPEKEMLDLIPVDIIPEGTDPSDIFMVLGHPHLKGRKKRKEEK